MIAAQHVRLQQLYPAFRRIMSMSWRAGWEGVVYPIDGREYRLRLIYYPFPRPTAPGKRFINPRITVLSPQLELDPHGLVPHSYINDGDPTHPLLCVYDPDATEWTPDMPIADTILPWTCRWLLFYEGWLATGEWLGRGRHPGP